MGIDSVLVLVDEHWGDTCILSDPPVTCLTFREYSQTKRYVLRSGDSGMTFRHLCDELDVLPKCQQGKAPMDVRCKMYFFSSDTVMFTACVDRYKTLLDGEYYLTTKRLHKVIGEIAKMRETGAADYVKTCDKHEIVAGKDSLLCFLQKRIPLLFGCSAKAGSVDVLLSCMADGKGRNVRAYVSQVLIDGVKMKIPEVFAEELKGFINKVVRWNENKERTIFDLMPIRVSFSLNEKTNDDKSTVD
ncbi:MAG: hypothetical protein K2H16_03360 [Prevotella sp.]|nr:hypothetical protein [Prevotella sp.]